MRLDGVQNQSSSELVLEDGHFVALGVCGYLHFERGTEMNSRCRDSSQAKVLPNVCYFPKEGEGNFERSDPIRSFHMTLICRSVN